MKNKEVGWGRGIRVKVMSKCSYVIEVYEVHLELAKNYNYADLRDKYCQKISQ